MQASVKILRSFDYCHFEVALSMDVPDPEEHQDTTGVVLDSVNDLRKQAAVLVDEAVRQYKIAKAKESARAAHDWEARQLLDKIERIKARPESDWGIEEAALMRAYADKTFWKDFQEDDYFYEDSEREHHFSMLRRFKESRVSATTNPQEPQ